LSVAVNNNTKNQISAESSSSLKDDEHFSSIDNVIYSNAPLGQSTLALS